MAAKKNKKSAIVAKPKVKAKAPLQAPKSEAPKKAVTAQKGKKDISYRCLIANQGKNKIVCFSINAKELWNIVEINQRDPDKDTGYQRAFSPSRVNTLKSYIEKGNSIPVSILIALDNESRLSEDASTLFIPEKADAGWVIDGQHRLIAAKNAEVDIDLIVIAILNANEKEQIKQFITINQEAKGVPRSLYYDLLRHLPPDKSDTDLAKERAVDIANDLKKEEDSPLYSKIVISAPKQGEISLNNFVRKIYPLLGKNGFFKSYSLLEQTKIINNYFLAFRNLFPDFFELPNPIFLKTIGFGGIINALPTVFRLCLKHSKGFTVSDIIYVLNYISDFDFSTWNELGTGTGAEKQVGEDLIAEITRRIDSTGSDSTTVRL